MAVTIKRKGFKLNNSQVKNGQTENWNSLQHQFNESRNLVLQLLDLPAFGIDNGNTDGKVKGGIFKSLNF